MQFPLPNGFAEIDDTRYCSTACPYRVANYCKAFHVPLTYGSWVKSALRCRECQETELDYHKQAISDLEEALCQ
jgi:hypothetical protein